MSREIGRLANAQIQLAEINAHVSTPGKHTLVEAMHMSAVQRRASETGEPDAAAVHAAAARGVATSSSPLPHGDRIQRLFGRHDISAVQAHSGTDAAASARAMGAAAYATGNHVVLGGKNDLHTVAHEAAHVVQQRDGVHLKRGVGEVGDAHERHADEVADAVTRGESVEELLGNPGNPTASTMSDHAVQRMHEPGADEPKLSLKDRFNDSLGADIQGNSIDQPINGQPAKMYQVSPGQILFHGTSKAFKTFKSGGQLYMSVFGYASSLGDIVMIVEIDQPLRLLDLSNEATVKAILLTEDDAALHDALEGTTGLHVEGGTVQGTFRKGTVGKLDNFLCDWTKGRNYDGFIRLPVGGKGFPEIAVHAMDKLRLLGNWKGGKIKEY